MDTLLTIGEMECEAIHNAHTPFMRLHRRTRTRIVYEYATHACSLLHETSVRFIFTVAFVRICTYRYTWTTKSITSFIDVSINHRHRNYHQWHWCTFAAQVCCRRYKIDYIYFSTTKSNFLRWRMQSTTSNGNNIASRNFTICILAPRISLPIIRNWSCSKKLHRRLPISRWTSKKSFTRSCGNRKPSRLCTTKKVDGPKRKQHK